MLIFEGEIAIVRIKRSHKRCHSVKYLPKKSMVIILKKEGDIIVNNHDIRKWIGSLDTMKTVEKISEATPTVADNLRPRRTDKSLVNEPLH